MGFPCPRRAAAAVVVVALISTGLAGCNSHERVETALAKGAFVSVAPARHLTPVAAPVAMPWATSDVQSPQYSISNAPPQAGHAIVGRAADAPHRAVSSPVAPGVAKLSATATSAADLRVMSFNLRVPFLLDATNHWGFRKKNVIKTIQDFQPDVLGAQECVAEQADYLREQFPEYGFRGVGRGDGDRKGEFAPVLYRRDKFKELDHGYFWLSETPHKPGSKSWGAWSTRMCTWVKLQPLDGGPAFAVFNAHLDNMSGRSRANSARLMHEKIVALASGMGVIVTGDFNTDAGTEPYRLLLVGEQLGVPQLLFDAFRVANPKVGGDEGTRHDFNGGRSGNRIDWILCNTVFTPVSAEINRWRGLLGYPSDHYPVQAILRPSAVASRTPTSVAHIE